jgi:D-lyxose ketol-isomerase
MLTRRNLIKSTGSALSFAAAAAAAPLAYAARGKGKGQSKLSFDNRQFYAADGSFRLDQAKKAVMRLCQHHGYPVFPGFQDGLWVSDYGVGQFAKMGLAAYIFVNSVEDQYMMLDLFLLPGQMLPEHWHVAAEGNPPKREGWLVRWGTSHIVGIGQPNLSQDVVVPKCHWGGKVTVEHQVVAKPGTFVPLAEVESRHWQYGGPQGAIVTEVATIHTGSGVRHTDPVLNEYFLKSL